MRELKRYDVSVNDGVIDAVEAAEGEIVYAADVLPHIQELSRALGHALAVIGWLRTSGRAVCHTPNLHMSKIDKLEDRARFIFNEYLPDEPFLDKCVQCGGWNGGVPGNENIVNGEPVCDYCSTAMRSAPAGVAGPQMDNSGRVR